MFGYECEIEDPAIYWGARAIFELKRKYDKRGNLKEICHEMDLLKDRQTFECKNDELKPEFLKWVNDEALPALKKHIKENNWEPRDEHTFTLENENFILKATPRASFGYIYIGAWAIPHS